MPQSQMTGVIRFGVFEVEPQTGILRKHGVRIRLQEQPFRVLLALIEKRGQVVTREELHQKIWGGMAFGDFEHSLNIAINKTREALGDSAETPRFVETLPRRGYRFIAPVEGQVMPAPAPSVPAPPTAPIPRWLRLRMIGTGLAAALIVGVVLWMLPPAPPRLEWRRLTNDNSEKIAPVLSDGARLYFRRLAVSGVEILQIPVSGGEPTELPATSPPGLYYDLLDLSPDRQELLLRPVKWLATAFTNLRALGASPLLTLRIADGSTRRVGNLLAREAKYSPDGRRIAFTSSGVQAAGSVLAGGGSLWVASGDGSNPRRLLERKDADVGAPCWSPDGSRIAFSQSNWYSPSGPERWSAWEIGADGTGLRRLFPDFIRDHRPAGWTPDGGLLLISEGQLWVAQPPRFFQFKRPPPAQLSTGDPLFAAPIQIQHSRAFYAVGTTQLGELQRYDTRSGIWEPHLGGIPAESVEYSRDGQSLLYVTHPEGELWVRRADGSGRVQLTTAPTRAQVGRWSPDDRVIAFSGTSAPDQPSRIYLVDAAGGNVRLVCPKECEGQDLAWMPDGKGIVFSNYDAKEPVFLRLVDLGGGEVTRFPGSEGLHSPRMSPDGSSLAALAIPPGGGVWLYRFRERVWKELPHPGPGRANWPSWSRDSQWIWYCNFERSAIMRVDVRENRNEEMLPFKLAEMAGLIGSWFNLTPNDEPMVLRRRDVQQIYALELKPQ